MYKKAKEVLKGTADMAKSQFSSDKPMIREIINGSADDICKDRYFNLSEDQKNLLHNYACTLHPKE